MTGASNGGTADAFKRISQSLPEMVLVTGVLARVLHVVFNVHGEELEWISVVGTAVVVPVVVLAMATVYLANYPVRQWLWRAPAFALGEIVVEAFTSLGLIVAGRERWGTGRATPGEWPVIAGGILGWRFVTMCLFALMLGAVVQWVRRRELTAEVERRHHHGPPPGTPERRHSGGEDGGDGGGERGPDHGPE